MVKRLVSFALKLRKLEGNVSDDVIAKQTQTSLRTTQRYLRELREAGIIEISRKRYRFPGGSWGNYRKILWRDSNVNDVSEG